MFSNFTFDGKGSDEFGIICVSMYDSGKANYSGQTTKLVTEMAGQGTKFQMVDHSYAKPMQFYFQIVNKDFTDITPEQERYLNKWLCKRGRFAWMFIQDPRYSDIFFEANISNPQVIVISGVVGLEYTVTTSSALCFSDEYDCTVNLTKEDNSCEIFLFNDDECVVTPHMEITFHEPGDFQLYNEAEENEEYSFVLKNVSVGEKITMEYYPYFNLISSIETHDIWNDSNAFQFRFYDGINKITANLDCSINFKYREPRKLIIY